MIKLSEANIFRKAPFNSIEIGVWGETTLVCGELNHRFYVF